jgi:hypothetical protein
MVTVGEYTELFMTVILGLGVTFELPILVFFLALFGIVSAVAVEEYPLRHPGHFHHRRDYHPYPGCADDVRVCRADAGALPGEYWGRLHGPSQPKEPAQRAVMKLSFRAFPAACGALFSVA